MIWADKLAALWFCLVVLLFTGMNGMTALEALFFSGGGLMVLAIMTLVPWLVLRAIDFILGGPARRHPTDRVVGYWVRR